MLGTPGQTQRLPYSIASAPEETEQFGYLEFLLKMESGGWGPHLSGLKHGAEIAVKGPVGRFVFPPAPEETQFLFVAGGSGISPLRSMIIHALMTQRHGRLHLLYSARTPSDFAYLPELRRYEREGQLQLALTSTREIHSSWRGEKGRITLQRLERLVEAPETLCFVCGPAAMVEEVPRMLMTLGIEKKRIRIEEW
jgi:ferredoxin-NADP reductase